VCRNQAQDRCAKAQTETAEILHCISPSALGYCHFLPEAMAKTHGSTALTQAANRREKLVHWDSDGIGREWQNWGALQSQGTLGTLLAIADEVIE
jgi:hypothetical protein